MTSGNQDFICYNGYKILQNVDKWLQNVDLERSVYSFKTNKMRKQNFPCNSMQFKPLEMRATNPLMQWPLRLGTMTEEWTSQLDD